MSQNIYSLWEKIAEKSPGQEAVVHWNATGSPVRWSYETLLEKALRYSLNIKELGIRKGDVCALILSHNPRFYPLYVGIVSMGAIPAVLAYPNPRLHPQKFREGLEGMCRRSGLDWIFSEKSMEPILSHFLRQSTVKGMFFIEDFESKAKAPIRTPLELNKFRPQVSGSDPLLLQHSSGTTGLQKPVLLTNKAVMDHIKNYSRSLRLEKNDKIVSWLPLYHDMGLIAAFHLPLAVGIPSIQIDPFQWVVAPSILLEVISREKATLVWLPNFAYNFMANSLREDDLDGISLGSVRMIINCSEPVRNESHQKFLKKLAKRGLKEEHLAASYAMAETTFAVTQSEPGMRLNKIRLDREMLSHGKVKIVKKEVGSRICVSSGKLIPGCEIKIVDESGKETSEDNVGEVAVRSVSSFEGYRNYPEKTREVLKDGWYFSGDLGFEKNGEYFIIGRKKDIIIVAGKNIYPEDIEDAVGNIPGIIPGRVIAFGEEDAALGTESVSVIAETKVSENQKIEALNAKIKEVAATQCDITVKKVYFVPSRWLIKSSSGKPSRSANKARILKE